MNILALETSGLTGSVAVCVDDRPAIEITLDPAQRSAQSMALAIQQALQAANVKPADIELIAVTHGPGSFTGLRVGVVTAKMFAYAVGCAVVGVNTLEVIATGVATDREIVTVIDAQRGELFSARWRSLSDEHSKHRSLECVLPTSIMTIDDWLLYIRDDDLLLGPGLLKHRERLADRELTEASFHPPLARHVASVGRMTFERDGGDDPFKLVPQYFRRTAAEEQWDRRISDKQSQI